MTENFSCTRSSTEMLEADEKFFCNSCRCLQEAQKRMKIATLPRVLCLHLKRFKYIEQLDRRASSTCDGVVQRLDTLHHSATVHSCNTLRMYLAQCVALTY